MLKACKRSLSSFMCELLTLILFILFGIIYLLIITCIQTYYYVFDLFINNQKYKNEVEQSEYNGYKEIDREMFTTVWDLIWNHDEEEIEVKDIVTKIKQKLKIDLHIRNQLFCNDANLIRNEMNIAKASKIESPRTKRFKKNQYHNPSTDLSHAKKKKFHNLLDESCFDSSFALKQYNAIKRFLCDNSITVSKYERIKEKSQAQSPIHPSLSRVRSEMRNEARNASNTSSNDLFQLLTIIDISLHQIAKAISKYKKKNVKVIIKSHFVQTMK